MLQCLMFLQEKSEQMIEYIKRLKQCIKWFQQIEGNYVTEQEKIKKLLELAEKKCNDMGILVLYFIDSVPFLLKNVLVKNKIIFVELSKSDILITDLSESLMKAKEDELNSIIMELRKNLESLQEKFAKEEVDKLV